MSKVISRPVIPSFGTKAELFAYLRKNEKEIIAQKKAFPIKSDDFEFGYDIVNSGHNGATKAATDGLPDMGAGELAVDIYANLAGWCDTYMDVMIKDNWNKSIKDLGASGEKIFYHLKNHDYCTDAVIGKDASLYTKMVNLSQFNVESDIKKAQALMMKSTVVKEYDPKCFALYRDKQIKQHSIGLRYIKIYLCIDSEEPEDAMYKDYWDKFYAEVINKDKVDSKGYFWAVVESQILEVSTVLYGANELTPVESTGDSSKSTPSQPSGDTEDEPQDKGQKSKEINFAKMAALLEG